MYEFFKKGRGIKITNLTNTNLIRDLKRIKKAGLKKVLRKDIGKVIKELQKSASKRSGNSYYQRTKRRRILEELINKNNSPFTQNLKGFKYNKFYCITDLTAEAKLAGLEKIKHILSNFKNPWWIVLEDSPTIINEKLEFYGIEKNELIEYLENSF